MWMSLNGIYHRAESHPIDDTVVNIEENYALFPKVELGA